MAILKNAKFTLRPRFARLWVSTLLVVTLVLGGLPPGWADSVTPRIVSYRLPTGQMLYIKEDHSQPIVTIDTWVKVGSVNETDEVNGVSHFLEHLLFKGTEQYGPGEVDRLLESRGSEFNAATSDDFTHYYITTATPYFEEALALHADMLLNSTIPETELPQERKVVQEEINRAMDNPHRQLFSELSKQLYGNHGYALDTLGPKEVIANIPRARILEYYHYWYQPRNFNTVIVGDVDADKVKELVAKAFPAPPFQRPKDYQPPAVDMVTPRRETSVKVLENPNVSQAYMALGMLGPALQKPEDVYALDIAMLALGSGKSSRLYQALKEQKPLATSVSASNYTQKYSGLLMLYAEAKPENRTAVKKELLHQLNRLKQEGITQSELEKAKTQYLKDFIFENETTDGTASSIGYNVTIGSLENYLSHVANVEKVTLDAVQDALNRYIRLDQAVFVELLPAALKADLRAETDENQHLLADVLLAPQASPVGAATADLTNQTAEAAEAPSPEITKTVLGNGMTLLLKPRRDSRTVAIKVFVKGGQGVERIPGIASLVASVMMQGTQNRTAEEISRELERQGMSLAVSADEDFMEVTGSAIQEDVGELFVILKDVLTRPVFAEAEIAKKKEQLRQAITASQDNPSAVAFEQLTMALYPSHGYGNQGARIKPHLDHITRQDLLDYYHLYFQPENMVVSVVGNVDAEMMTSYLTSVAPDCSRCAPSPLAIPEVPSLPGAPRLVKTEKPQLSAVWLAQGWLAPSIDQTRDYAALKVLNSLLGAGMSSRLFVDLRDKQGLAYVVGSMYPSRAQDSRFVMYIGTDPANTDAVKAGFAKEIKRLQSETVPARELAEAKSKLVGSFALAHDTNLNQSYYLGLYETLGVGYEFDRTYPGLIEQVTAEDIQRVARQYLSEDAAVLSLVKPANDETPSRSAP